MTDLRRAPRRSWMRVAPWWVTVLLIFAGSRVITTIILLVFAHLQQANPPWTGADPDYFSFASIWDAKWYNSVAAAGYPSVLPYNAQGHIDQNAWAFLPAYPFLVKVITALTGHTVLSGSAFSVVGVLVSVGFAAGSALVFFRLLEDRLGRSTAMFAVALFCVAPLSPILQVAYAESMLVFFLLCSLYFLQKRQYYAMLPFLAVMAFTRPSALPFALAMGLHVVYRWCVRSRDSFPVRERVAAVVVTLASLLLGYAWPLIAALVTGVPNAYTATELAWRAPYVGWGELVPFSPWVQGAIWWSKWGGWSMGAGGAIVVLVLAVLFFGILMFTPWVKRLGVDLRLWTASWVVYLLAVFFPQSSIFRLFIPAFPLLGALAIPRSRVYRAVVVLLFIAGQIGWIYLAYWVDGVDWTPP